MIRVAVADDHPVVREGLKRILADCHDIEVIAEADDADSAVAACQGDSPDVLLMDLSMPGPGFPETLRRVRGVSPKIRVLVLSVHPEEHFALRTLELQSHALFQSFRTDAQKPGLSRVQRKFAIDNRQLTIQRELQLVAA